MNIKKSLANNFVFQLLYQVVVLVIPLVLSPFLTRKLGSEALGVYSYVNSIACYFVLFANLGIARHGQRIISQTAHDKEKQNKAFWSLFVLHIFVSSISILVYILFSLIFGGANLSIFLIEIFYVASALFDITWFFYGLENFKNVVIKNLFVKVSECILIFIFVRNSSDLWVYTLISALGLLVGQLIMIPQALKISKPVKFDYSDIKQHIRPLFVLFISVLASSLFTVFDKTLLGLMGTFNDVAFYEYSQKIVAIPKVIICVIGTVMMPRACALVKDENISKQKELIAISFLFVNIVSFSSILGLCAVAKEFAIIYYGSEFESCGAIIMCLSPVIYTVGAGDVLRSQVMIPNHMDKKFSIIISISALSNIILSIALIPFFGIYGAVIGSVFAEFLEFILTCIFCFKTIILALDLSFFVLLENFCYLMNKFIFKNNNIKTYVMYRICKLSFKHNIDYLYIVYNLILYQHLL